MYNKNHIITYDYQKNGKNIKERGISFDSAAHFNFDTALISIDSRHDYAETRYIALGSIKARLHVLVFTEVEYGIRVISLRKANIREMQRYDSHHH